MVLEGESGPLPGAAASSPALQELGQRLAMQVVAMKPRFLARGEVPADELDKEKEILRAQVAASGKPEAVIDKMVTGRLSKFYQETCLLDQGYLMDDKTPVAKVGGSVRSHQEVGPGRERLLRGGVDGAALCRWWRRWARRPGSRASRSPPSCG